MHKKGLLFGAAALSLLVLFAVVGCSHPTDGPDKPAVPPPKAVGGVNYPQGTVFMKDFVGFQSLLDSAEAVSANNTNHIAYNGPIDSVITIPEGKTVYLNGGPISLADNHHLIVSPGAKVVLASDLTTSENGRLLIKGTVEVYGKLTLTSTGTNDPALQVADYFEADNSVISGRGTVIGTPRLSIAPSGTLVLTAADIANQPAGNRFTLAQAWAAAGHGNLVITGTLSPAYTVKHLLEGIALPAAGRTYTVSTQGGGVLPALIPAGADITANGVITDAENHNLTVNGAFTAANPASTLKDIEYLTVNGKLIANAATLEKVVTLVVSSWNSGGRASRASTGPDAPWNGGYLGADKATLEKAERISIGDYGEFSSESTLIDLPEGAKITLGRSARFNALGTSKNSFDNLTSLSIGPAAKVTIASPALTFNSLKTLTLQDSASLEAAAGNMVTFLLEETPSVPPQKTGVTLGANVYYHVGTSPKAKLDVAVSHDSSLISGSTLVLNEGSTLTVAAGKKLTVQSGAALDLRNLVNLLPANAAPIQINGAIELTGTGTLIGRNPGLFTNPQDVFKVIAFGPNGKILLNYGTTYVLGAAASPDLAAVPFIGGSTADAYQWGPANDGAQISIDASGVTIRDRNGSGAVVTSNATATQTYAHILKDQALLLDTGVELKLNNGKGIFFAPDAQLKGPGKVTAGRTTITGGSSGWQVFGTHSIGILQENAGFSYISNLDDGSIVSLRAMGPNAVIRQAAGTDNAVAIAANTVVALGGTATRPGGSIVLESGSWPGKLALGGTPNAQLQLGPGSGGMNATGGLNTITIGGRTVINSGLSRADFSILDNKLVVIGGANRGAGNGITAGNTAGNDVTIVSNAAFTNR